MHKESLVSTLASLPAEVDAEDIIEKVLFLKNLEKATAEADSGQLLTEEEVKARLGKWLS